MSNSLLFLSRLLTCLTGGVHELVRRVMLESTRRWTAAILEFGLSLVQIFINFTFIQSGPT